MTRARSTARRVAQVMAIQIIVPLAGCSYLFTSDGPRSSCSTSKAPPVIDSLVATYQVARTGYAMVAVDEVYEDAVISREADIGFGLAFSALFIASAYYGYDVTSDCSHKQDSGRPPDESGDATATFRNRRAAMVPTQPPAVRSELHLGSLDVALLSLPESEPDAVAVRIESRYRTQRFKGCTELQIVHEGTAQRIAAGYHADVAHGAIREVFTARVSARQLLAATTAQWSSLGVCGHHQLLNATAQTRLRSFLQRHAARRAAPDPGPAPAPPPLDGTKVAVLDANLTLSNVVIDLYRQPSAFAQHVFVMVPGLRLLDPGCQALELAIDGAKTVMPLRRRENVDEAPFVALEVELVERIAASSDATIAVCGHPYKLTPPDRAALAALAHDLAPPAPAPPSALPALEPAAIPAAGTPPAAPPAPAPTPQGPRTDLR